MKLSIKLEEVFKTLILILLISVCSSCGDENYLLDKRCYQFQKHQSELNFPKEIHGYNNYEFALDCAKKTNKPLLIYFTAFSCKNCRPFEQGFLYTSEVIKLINENFVFAALTLDDKTELPPNEQVIVISKTGAKRRLNNIGHLNSSLHDKYPHSSQPTLFIANNAEEIISFITFNNNPEAQLKKLKEVIQKINKH